MVKLTAREILAAEQANPCPYGLVRASDAELAVAEDALRKGSKFLISEGAAHNLAYAVLLAIRHAHFDWHETGRQALSSNRRGE